MTMQEVLSSLAKQWKLCEQDEIEADQFASVLFPLFAGTKTKISNHCEDWAIEEGNLHRLLGSTLLRYYRRSPTGARCTCVLSFTC